MSVPKPDFVWEGCHSVSIAMARAEAAITHISKTLHPDWTPYVPQPDFVPTPDDWRPSLDDYNKWRDGTLY